MKNILSNLIYKIRSNKKIQNLLYYFLVGSVSLYTFSLPSFSGRGGWNYLSYLFIALLITLCILYTFFYSKFKFNFLTLCIPLFVLVASIGTIIFSKRFENLLTIFLLTLTMYAYYYAFLAINNKRLVLKTIVYALLGFAAYFFYVYSGTILRLRVSSRIGDYFDNLNLIGCYFSLGFLISFFLTVNFLKKRELFYIIPAGIFGVFGLFTGSRTFLILVIVSFLSVLFIRFRKKPLVCFLILGGTIGIFFLLINLPIFSFLKNQFAKTLTSLFGIGNAKTDPSSIHRYLWQKYGYFLASRNLLLGYGCEGFAVISGVGTYTHSNFAEVLCNFGLIGFSLFYAPFILCTFLVSKGKKEETLIVIAILVYSFFRGFFAVSYYFKDSYLIFGLIFYLTSDRSFRKVNA